MKIFVTGTRGIPDIPGGVEKHCQELFPRVAARGHEVLLATRSSYVTRRVSEWRGVKLVNCFAPRTKSFEAIVHTFISLLKALSHSPDVVHIHAAPMLLTPLARLMGFKVVVTIHGPEYNRKKWGPVAKCVLRLGEKLAGLFANEVIVISSVIRDIIVKRCNRVANLIPNGVTLPRQSKTSDLLTGIGVDPGSYIVAVARFVPEKGLHDLINAFETMNSDCKIVIAGDADHESDYSKNLLQMASEDNRIILTGYITGEPLNQVYSHARLFVLPSYHEGLAISLLEAMSYGIPVLASDIPANKEVGLPDERYFRCGDVADLKRRMQALLDKGLSDEESEEIRKQMEEKYNWDNIAEQTIEVYRKAVRTEVRDQRAEDRGQRVKLKAES